MRTYLEERCGIKSFQRKNGLDNQGLNKANVEVQSNNQCEGY